MAQQAKEKSATGAQGEAQADNRSGASPRRFPIRSAATSWSTLGERVASPNEIAKELGSVASGTSSYHIKVLSQRELIRLVRTAKRRGAMEHFYELTESSFSTTTIGCEFLSSSDQASAQACSKPSWMKLGRRCRAGTFNARESHVSRTTMILR